MTKSLQGNTTHVILTQSWYYHLDDRFQLVEKSKFKKLEWLLDCASQGKLLCGEDSKYCWFPGAAPKTGNSMAGPIAEPKTGTGKVRKVRHSGKEYEVTIQQARKRNGQDRMRIQSLGHQFQLVTEWGWLGRISRVSGIPVVAASEEEAVAVFKKKFYDKTKLNWSDRSKATTLRPWIFHIPPPQTRGLSAPVQDLLRLVFDEDLVETSLDKYGYNWRMLPVHQLTDHTLRESAKILKDWREHLKELKKLETEEAEREESETKMKVERKEIKQLREKHRFMIPHKVVGRVRLGFDIDSFENEVKLLQLIQGIRATPSMPPCSVLEKENLLDWQYDKLGMEIENLSTQSTQSTAKRAEYNSLLQLYIRSIDKIYPSDLYKVKGIFRLKKKDEIDNRHVENRRLLWHGTRCITVAGILSQGLRVPHYSDMRFLKAKFGNGIYFTDTASFATEYCGTNDSNGHALLFLCEVALGEMLHCDDKDADPKFDPKKRLGEKCHSTLGIGRYGPRADVEVDWRDAKFIDERLRGIRVVSLIPGTIL
ncbi:Poly [ADP-ribose] polymerase 2-A [Metarhizium anisopliae]|nr:Poly [ADP-ribose] polymerase 2-A [Metarhizium anisopliae]